MEIYSKPVKRARHTVRAATPTAEVIIIIFNNPGNLGDVHRLSLSRARRGCILRNAFPTFGRSQSLSAERSRKRFPGKNREM